MRKAVYQGEGSKLDDIVEFGLDDQGGYQLYKLKTHHLNDILILKILLKFVYIMLNLKHFFGFTSEISLKILLVKGFQRKIENYGLNIAYLKVRKMRFYFKGN